MNWTRAELERKLAENPDLALEATERRSAAFAPKSGIAPRNAHLAGQRAQRAGDTADVLLGFIKQLAPALYERCERDRKFGRCRIDIAIGMVAVEVNGGYAAPRGGKHGTDRDHQKIRRLTRAGYTVLVFTAHEVRTNPAGVVAELVEVAGD